MSGIHTDGGKQIALLEQTRPVFHELWPGFRSGRSLLFRFLQAEIKSGWPGFLWKQPNTRQRLFSLDSEEHQDSRFRTACCWRGFDPLMLGL